MNPENVERHQRRLLALRGRVKRDFEGLRVAIREEAGHPSDIGHVRTHIADADMEGLDANLIVGETEGKILQSIENSLARIQAGTYGICSRCGRQITERRLHAVPYAAHCIECEKELEARASRA